MKKNFLRLMMLFVAAVLTNNAFAQGSLLATLSHEGTISTYYGVQAWKQAHDAAENGDVITLSSGIFNSVDITKAITVRGAGMGIDTTAVGESTIILGDFNINIAEPGSNRLTLEGIYSNHMITYMNVINPLFLKCRLKSVTYYDKSNSVLKDASFIHCRIADELWLASNSSASCVNSVIEDPYSASVSASNFEFVNCDINFTCTNYKAVLYLSHVYSSSFKNCVINVHNSNDNVDSSCTAYNCVGFGSGSMFKYVTNATNKTVSDYASLFKTYTGANLGNLNFENFELTDAAKTQYLGTDGTEVGIYGGSLPFDPTPSIPQITKCNVAAKSTADGKLSVDIEVNAAE